MANLLATGGCMALAVLLVGCATPSSCGLGGEKVVIPASDTSPPSVSVDFVMPDGKTVSLHSPGGTQSVAATRSGIVTIVASVQDGQGVKDVQIWASERRCEIDGDSRSCSAPVRSNVPSASSPDGGRIGDAACNIRRTSHNVQIGKNDRIDLSQQVEISGLNFGGQLTQLGTITIRVR